MLLMAVHLPPFIFYLATACAFSSILLSSALIYLHLKNYRKPLEQRLIVRILLLLPFYALTSWIGLIEATETKYSTFVHLISSLIDPLEEAYEALVIYTFFSLLTQLLGGERNLVLNALGRAPKPHPGILGHYLPFIDISDPRTFLSIKRGILQYVWIKPLLSVVMLITKLTHTYRDGYISWSSGYAWIGAVYNISISVSLYSLALFWYTLNEDLKPFKPMPKFMCIKIVIFFSYWQGVLLAIAGWFGWIPDNSSDESKGGGSYSAAIQNTLMCIEMIGFSIGHWYAFNYNEFDEKKLVQEIREKQAKIPLLNGQDNENEDCSFGEPRNGKANENWKIARFPLPYALRDVFGCLDLLLDFKATFTGKDYTYRQFDASASTRLDHPLAARSREKKIRQGLRYAQGGKAKYWLPDANEVRAVASSPSSSSGIKGYGAVESFNPNLKNQEPSSSQILRDSSSTDNSESEASDHVFISAEEFINDDRLYESARKLSYGDYNCPVITPEPIPEYEPIQKPYISTRDPYIRQQLDAEYQSFLVDEEDSDGSFV